MEYESKLPIDYGQREHHSGVDEIFYKRWSPRSFNKVAIPKNILEAIFDAARWSPSCFNAQPWRFITASSEAMFAKFLTLLSEKNQLWASNASVLGFICSKNEFDHNPRTNRMAPFDSGAAWMAMTMQARMFGLYTHAMAGIDVDAVYDLLEIDRNNYTVQCGFALGAIEDPNQLDPAFIEKEKPSARKPLTEIWFENSFSS